MKNSRICCAVSGLSVLLSFVPTALAAGGEPCVEDADCGEGYACDRPPTAGSATDRGGDAEDVPPATSGQADGGNESGAGGGGSGVATEGTCERAHKTCKTDADCGQYYVCALSESTFACDSDGNCTVGDTEPEEEEGFCSAKLVSCSRDSECPSGSECVDGTCTIDLTSCEDDSECEAGYECLSWDERECSSPPPCLGTDDACETEPVCEPSDDTTSFCFPKAKACSTDDDCSASWACYDMEDEEDAPEDWAGVDQGCLPPALVGAFEGYVYVTLDGVAMGSGESSEASDAPPRGGGTDPSDESGQSDSSGAKAQSASTSKNDGDGGCSLCRSGPSRTSPAGLMAMALLAAAAVRRRAA
jgi:MYXO-CTERM domain-containing protein